ITQRILFFNFTSQEERNDLVRQAVSNGVQEAVRIFVAQKTDPFVASANVQGLVNDFGAGITSKYSLLNARTADGTKTLDIGMKQIHQGSWNSIAGLQDTYSRDIFHSIADSGTFRDPYTGEIIPMRAEWTDISTEGPTDKLAVDPEAILWDPARQEWVPVVEGSAALSKVTFKPLFSNWHHGEPMGVSDLMFTEYFAFEWGTDSGEGDQTVDPEFTSQVSVAIPLLKGIKFGANEIVIFIDQWHYDDKEIADSGVFWVTEPWEITAATERLVVDGKLAYSRSEANVKGVGWLDPLVKDHADMILAELRKMKSESFVPNALEGIVSAQDAIKRYDASIKWIEDHDHAIISNGAFYLDSFNTAGGVITIKAFRDDSYPFEVGHWSEYETPSLADITSVNVPRSIAIGQSAAATVNLEVAGQPSSDASVDYFISNKDAKVVVQGKAEPVSTGQFRFELSGDETAKLSPGPNQVKIFASSFKALRPDIVSSTILATGAGNNQTSNNQTGSNGETPTAPSGCLIATAAFGSELSPQVQYLRNFREHYILSTMSGSAFMNSFNSIYYSFSPQVADYEREHPWLQDTVKAALYPLFGILAVAERMHFAASGGEAGAIVSGTTASMLIGAVYLWPAAVSSRVQKRFPLAVMISLAALSASVVFTVAGVLGGNSEVLAISTPIFILSVASSSALVVGRLARSVYRLITTGKY
ncbi:MAG TPA: CFI-box-CTERM domain-containing protein, partial [Nitrososphaera sp.]|nr:CFI-box-CTERM domain-containing protein [Nitrososphaera sp.]